MSPLSADLPSPPETAHLRYPKGTVTRATGFESASNKDPKKPKDRSRPRPTPDFFPKPPKPSGPSGPSEVSEDKIFTYFQKKADREDGASCVFLLWGSRNSESFKNWAVDVPIAGFESEDEIFTLLSGQYTTVLSFLRRYLSFRKFSRLRPVTFRFISRSSERFSVFARPLDLTNIRKLYSMRLEEAKTAIQSITDPDSENFPDKCYLDNEGDYIHCNSGCPASYSAESEFVICPFEELEMCNEYLLRIETMPFLSCYFRDPASARSQSILNGFGGHSFIRQYRQV
ncbi:hypothetical protein G6011_08105 [Alternaria panax]|uniref:Uncharacterized protein n=1 Tax=Alternaria panax TaxID=48097 RepID=A0AAD4I8E6_9PLEO|nr:hypothetical protein G6011_08105 [Alternaria panax]